MHEFEIIERYFTSTKKHRHVQLGVGDDAAITDLPSDCELVTSIDTLVSGIHFPEETRPEDMGYKAIAVSLSDMAAMGATPATVLVTLTLPEVDENWLQAFTLGLNTLIKQYDMALIGGDLTKGPLSMSTVVNGFIPKGKAILRSGANVGDLIYVTGPLGDAGLALQQRQQSNIDPSLLKKLNRPTPRVDAGISLRNIASAAIDISDGLASDLEKLCDASEVGADIDVDRLPLSPILKSALKPNDAIALALTAGDDFELCFTAAPDHKTQLDEIFSTLSCDAHCIGQVCENKAVHFYQGKKLIHLKKKGYEHF